MVSPQDVLSTLAGAWVLLNSSATNPDGTPVNRTTDTSQGRNGTGTLIYAASGYVSAILTPTDPLYRPRNLTYNDFDNTTDAEWAVLGKHNLAYTTPISVQVLPEGAADQGIVTHGPIKMANVPSLEGTNLVRNFTLMEEGRVLRLRIRASDGVRSLLYWGRM
ncbi:hypothetical protein BU26DRAFT_467400, partial [Trematosphaeria pertusa]